MARPAGGSRLRSTGEREGSRLRSTGETRPLDGRVGRSRLRSTGEGSPLDRREGLDFARPARQGRWTGERGGLDFARPARGEVSTPLDRGDRTGKREPLDLRGGAARPARRGV